MCGIAGIVSTDEAAPALDAAQDVQRHRGPSSHGSHVDRLGRWTLGLGFQRLAILDLSAAGDQPMRSENGKSWLVYNGEVYNYRELRRELESLGRRFRGESDTEVVLAALEVWGIEAALNRFNGMWAFAWFDSEGHRLVLSRDRLGVKPLYYSVERDRLLFASEIKTIVSMSGGRYALNPEVVSAFLSQSLLDIDAQTFFEGVQKLPQASYAVVDLRRDGLVVEPKVYWHLDPEAAPPWPERDATEGLRSLLTDAVRLRLRSDVPVGVLLSGGLDSSAIANTMREILGPDAELNLLSAVSNDPASDESPFIDIMSRHLNGRTHKVMIDFDAEEALRYLSDVCWANDEPPGTLSPVAQYLLMRHAKEMGVTVILSGQGADETLCGYRKYVWFHLRELARRGKLPTAALTALGYLRNGTVLREFTLGEARRYLPWFPGQGGQDIRGEAVAHCARKTLGLATTVQARQADDVMRFSIPIITHSEDRMSMAWSREIRGPFLDYRMVEALVPAPISWKLRDGWTKSLLRKAMQDHLPNEIAWRRDKKGFSMPESSWLRGRLRPHVEALFAPDAEIFRRRLIDPKRIHTTYDRFCKQSGAFGTISAKEIFNAVTLELWLRRFSRFLS